MLFIVLCCRHPRPPYRPGFRDILRTLLKDEKTVLHIPPGDISTTQQAGILGASTQASMYMYTDLQQAYLSVKEKREYDHIADKKYMLSFPTSSADLEYLFDDTTSATGSTPRQSYRWTLLTSDTGSNYEDVSL